MTVPRVVEKMPELYSVSIDGMVWFSGNVRTGEPKDVLAVHLNPSTGDQCRRSPRFIGKHTIESRNPLTIRGSLACDEPSCSWHGWVTDGKWVPA